MNNEHEDEDEGENGDVEDASHEDAEAKEPENYFGSVAEFVSDFLAIVYARPTGMQAPLKWCSRWWAHPEALSRLEALWKAFEVQRQDPGTGAAVWWRDFADPTMAVLLSGDGPFRECGPREHALPPTLMVEEPDPAAFSN